MFKMIKKISTILVGCWLLCCCAGLVVTSCEDGNLLGGKNLEQDGDNDMTSQEDSTLPVSVSLESVTATTVQFHMALDMAKISQYDEAGLIFSSVDNLDVSAETATKIQINRESYSKMFTGLSYNTKYYYTTYLRKGFFYIYGGKKEFTTSNVSLELSVTTSTPTTVQITGAVEGLWEPDRLQIEVGVIYSKEEDDVEKGEGIKLASSEFSVDNQVSFAISYLTSGTKYYYRSYVKQGEECVYGKIDDFTTDSANFPNLVENHDVVPGTRLTLTILPDADWRISINKESYSWFKIIDGRFYEQSISGRSSSEPIEITIWTTDEDSFYSRSCEITLYMGGVSMVIAKYTLKTAS